MASSVFIWPGLFQYNGSSATVLVPILIPDGTASAPGIAFSTAPSKGFFGITGGSIGVSAENDDQLRFTNSVGPVIRSDRVLAWSSDTTYGSRDLRLLRDAANTLAQVNGINAQSSRLYGYSSGSRLTRGSFHTVSEALMLAGATTATTNYIPVGAFVIGVSTSTTTAITGATGYQVGDGTTATRYGDITGTAVGTHSDNTNATANPTGYNALASGITLTAKTSDFTGGVVQVTTFYLTTGSA